jgi:hypothetical protein
MVLGMNMSRFSLALRVRFPKIRSLRLVAGRPWAAARPRIATRLAPALGGALLAAALAWPPAACAAASGVAPAGTPRAAADSAAAPRERVLDVTLVSPGTAAPPEAAPRPGRPAALAPGAAARRGGPGSGPRGWGGWLAATMAVAAAAGVAAWRRRPRRCASCRAAMRRLGREEAFAELDMAERTEQLVGDVRYEVWRCAACGAVEKRGKERDLTAAQARAAAAPVGSAAFLRRRARAGLSIWSPPSLPPAPGIRPGRGGQPHVTETPSTSSTSRSTRSGP